LTQPNRFLETGFAWLTLHNAFQKIDADRHSQWVLSDMAIGKERILIMA